MGLGDLLVVQEPQPHRNEGAFGRTQAGHGSRFKQLPTGLSFNGNGREGVQHVDVEKRERRKRGVKEESSRRRRHVRESEPLWRGRTCCEIFFYRRLTIKKQRMCLAAEMWVEKNAFMAEYKASSAQYNTKSRTITETILTADKLSKAGKQEDAQKLYESAAQSMLDLKNEPEYA